MLDTSSLGRLAKLPGLVLSVIISAGNYDDIERWVLRVNFADCGTTFKLVSWESQWMREERDGMLV